MANEISVLSFVRGRPEDAEYVLLPFFFESKPLSDAQAPKWGMTILKAGSMRFRWNEQNKNRSKISEIFPQKEQVPIELIHSKSVVLAEKASDTEGIQADGIVTRNKNLLPTVTVADCMPIFLFDTVSQAIGVFHSGWKGTGIVAEGISLMQKEFGSNPQDIAAAIGPHIGDCCYFVNKERAEYFAATFGKKSVVINNEKNALSLTEANLFVLKNAGIKEENITIATDCTCCTKLQNGKNAFGSFRREAAFLSGNLDTEARSRKMTVQAAFCGYTS